MGLPPEALHPTLSPTMSTLQRGHCDKPEAAACGPQREPQRLSSDPGSEVGLCLNRTITLIAVCADYTVIIGLTIGEALLTPLATEHSPQQGRPRMPSRALYEARHTLNQAPGLGGVGVGLSNAE